MAGPSGKGGPVIGGLGAHRQGYTFPCPPGQARKQDCGPWGGATTVVTPAARPVDSVAGFAHRLQAHVVGGWHHLQAWERRTIQRAATKRPGGGKGGLFSVPSSLVGQHDAVPNSLQTRRPRPLYDWGVPARLNCRTEKQVPNL